MKFNKIFQLSALSLGLIGLWSCTKEVDYDPAVAPTNAQVYFASNAPSSFDIAEDQNSVVTEISRENTQGSVTVNLKASAKVGKENTDIFTVPASVTFTDGAKTAPIEITFDFNEIKAETTYTVSIIAESDQLTPYGKNLQEVKILYAPWSGWQGIGNAIFDTQTAFSWTTSQPIERRNSLLNPNQVQYNFPDLWNDGADYLINVDLSTNIVTVPRQNTYEKNGDYYIEFCDSYTFYSLLGRTEEQLAPYYGTSTFNPQTGVLSMNVVYFYVTPEGQVGYWGDTGFDYVYLPGYPDYEIGFSNKGTYISEAGQEFTIIGTTLGSDVASYAITLEQGYLEAADVEKVAADIIANTETTLYTSAQDFQFPVVEEDYYTVVAVAYGSDGEPHGNSYYTFYNEINGKDWNAGWTTVATAAQFNDLFCANVIVSGIYSWDVEVQQNDRNPGYYRIVKPYDNVYMETDRGHYYITIDATDPDAVVVMPSLTSMGYYVLSQAPGKLVDGTKFVFPAMSTGIFNGYDADGNMIVVCGVEDEEVLLDLDPQSEEETPAQAPRRNGSLKNSNIQKNLLLNYTGKTLPWKNAEKKVLRPASIIK